MPRDSGMGSTGRPGGGGMVGEGLRFGCVGGWLLGSNLVFWFYFFNLFHAELSHFYWWAENREIFATTEVKLFSLNKPDAVLFFWLFFFV
jgi:hypothetical protein